MSGWDHDGGGYGVCACGCGSGRDNEIGRLNVSGGDCDCISTVNGGENIGSVGLSDCGSKQKCTADVATD